MSKSCVSCKGVALASIVSAKPTGQLAVNVCFNFTSILFELCPCACHFIEINKITATPVVGWRDLNLDAATPVIDSTEKVTALT